MSWKLFLWKIPELVATKQFYHIPSVLQVKEFMMDAGASSAVQADGKMVQLHG